MAKSQLSTDADFPLPSITTTPPHYNSVVLHHNQKSKSAMLPLNENEGSVTSSSSNSSESSANSHSHSRSRSSSSLSSSSSEDCLSTKSHSKTSRAYTFEEENENDTNKSQRDNSEKNLSVHQNSSNSRYVPVVSIPRDASLETNQTIVTSIKSPSNYPHELSAVQGRELSGAVNSVLGDIIGIPNQETSFTISDDTSKDNNNVGVGVDVVVKHSDDNPSDEDDDIEPSHDVISFYIKL